MQKQLSPIRVAFTYFLSALGLPLAVIFTIPGIGRLLRQGWDGVLELFWRIMSLPETALFFAGVRPRKKIRIDVIILRDEDGVSLGDDKRLEIALSQARKIFDKAANTDLIVNSVQTVNDPAPTGALDPGCNTRAWLDDVGTRGSYYEATANSYAFRGLFQRMVGYAAPVTVYVVRTVGAKKIGCSLGPFSDYVTVIGRKPICIAHEIGHACGLLHVPEDKLNLMHPICGGKTLNTRQQLTFRTSRHVTFF